MNLTKDAELERLQKERMRHMEQLRRQGHSFIKVYLTAGITRIHSVKDILVEEYPDPRTGELRYEPREGDRIIEGVLNEATGFVEADILDCEYNRYWIAKNMNLGIEVVDKKLGKQIALLKDKEYKIASTRKEEIQMEINRLRKEEKRLDEEERAKAEIDEKVEKIEKESIDLADPTEGV